MRINHNMAALKSNMKLQRTGTKVEDSMEKLSSGYRINKAADDAAGMAISQKMRTQIRGLEQASRNASDGVSVIDTAEGALGEVEAMLQRMRELSVQVTNETYTEEDREQAQHEIDQLNQEIDRISTDTEFNTKKLLNGDADRQTYTNTSCVEIISVSDSVLANQYDITVVEAGTKATVTGGAIDPDGIGRTPAAGTVTLNGEKIQLGEGTSLAACFEALKKLGESVDISVTSDGNISKGSTLSFTSLYAGSARPVELYCDNEELATYLGISSSEDGMIARGTDAEIECGEQFDANTVTVAPDGNDVTITARDGFEMRFTIREDALEDGVSDLSAKLSVIDAGPIVLQIGANEGQTIVANIPRLDTETLKTALVNVQSTNGASKAIDIFDAAINKVSSVRAKLGAYSNRLAHSITSLDASDENLEGSLSRIEDLDMAKEMTSFTQLQVLQQAGTSMLSQANQLPQTVLNLLQG